MIDLVPFEPAHLSGLNAPRNDAGIFPYLNSFDYLKTLQRAGNAYSAYVPEGLLGCAGIGMREDGWPEAWMIGTALIDRHRVAFHRLVKGKLREIMAESGWRFVLASALADDRRARKWLERLGFVAVCPVVCYGQEYIRFLKEV
jgi:hypothetical protein